MGAAVKRLAVFMLLLLVGSAQSQSDSAAIITQAEAAYETGDNDQAVRLYQLLVDSGWRHENVYFNLGSAYYLRGDLGWALLNWRRAQVLAPRDSDIGRQLSLARRERTDIQGDETGWLESLAALSTGLVTPAELGWLALLAWSGWLGLISLWLLRRTWRDGLRALLIVGGVVVAGLMVLLGSRYWVDTLRPAAVVVQDQVSTMSGPGTQYLDLYPLHAAAEVRIMEQREGWLRIVLPNGRQGWLPAAAVERVEP